MRRLLIASLAAIVMAGCSNLPRSSGFEVREVEPYGRQEPWQNLAVRADPAYGSGLALLYVRIPSLVSSKWENEFTDPARQYWVDTVGGRKELRTLERVVWRANLYRNGAYVKTYDAVKYLNDGLTVLIPRSEVEHVSGQNLVILSSDGKWGMTTLGKVVEFGKDIRPDRLPTAFFRDHPSPIRRIGPIDLENKNDRDFITDLNEMFPRKPFRVGTGTTVYVGRLDVDIVLARFTSLDGNLDKLISCTGFKAGPETFTPQGATVQVTLYGISAAWALSKDDCLK